VGTGSATEHQCGLTTQALTLNLVQTGNSLGGSYILTLVSNNGVLDCDKPGTTATGPIGSGSVSGSTVVFALQINEDNGSLSNITFNGTVNGNSMAGTLVAETAHETMLGTWSATRQ